MLKKNRVNQPGKSPVQFLSTNPASNPTTCSAGWTSKRTSDEAVSNKLTGMMQLGTMQLGPLGAFKWFSPILRPTGLLKQRQKLEEYTCLLVMSVDMKNGPCQDHLQSTMAPCSVSMLMEDGNKSVDQQLLCQIFQ